MGNEEDVNNTVWVVRPCSFSVLILVIRLGPVSLVRFPSWRLIFDGRFFFFSFDVILLSRKELAQVAIVFVKLGLLTSVMSVVFVLCGLWASVMFHNNLKGYQVDYI